MDRHGQVKFLGKLQLCFKQVVLLLPRHGPVMVQPDLPHRRDGLVLEQRAHGGQLGTPVPVVDGHRGGVLLDQALRVDAQRGVEVGRGVRQLQNLRSIAGMRGTFQHTDHAARGQRRQQFGAICVELAGGIVRVGVKNVVHAFVSCVCGARLTRKMPMQTSTSAAR